jgi:hypothetical protein
MKLIDHFGEPCTPLDEQLDCLQLRLVSCLKPGRVVKDELRVVGKDEWAVDVVDPALDDNGVKLKVTERKCSIHLYGWLQLVYR